MDAGNICSEVKQSVSGIHPESFRNQIQAYLDSMTMAPGYITGVVACFALNKDLNTEFSELPPRAQDAVISTQLAYCGAWKLRKLVRNPTWSEQSHSELDNTNTELLMGYQLLIQAMNISAAWEAADELLSIRTDTYEWVYGAKENTEQFYADLEQKTIDVIVELITALPDTRPCSDIKQFAYGVGEFTTEVSVFPDTEYVKKRIEEERAALTAGTASST